MSNQELVEQLSETVASILPPGAARPEALDSLVERGLDSIGMVNLLATLEERFRISVPPEEITPENFATIASLAELVTRLTDRG